MISENAPKQGRISTYTSGCPQTQMRLMYIIALPPRSLVKKLVPT